MKNIVKGSDPEAFLSVLEDGKRMVVPPAELIKYHNLPVIGGTAKHPLFSVIGGIGGEIHIVEDGVAFELTVPPSLRLLDVWNNIQLGYEEIARIGRAFGGFELSVVPTIGYNVKKFLNEDELFQMCLIFGCDPDRDAFNTERGNYIVDALQHPLRYGGGHIHISGSRDIKEIPVPAVKILAMTVGTFVTMHSPFPDLDRERTYLYGKPGKFRIQEYGSLWNNVPDTDVGIEYRTPSNAWTTSSDIAKGLDDVIDYTVNTILPNRNLVKSLIEQYSENVCKAIIEGNAGLAEEIFNNVIS